MEISIKRISFLSSIGTIVAFALACASSGCADPEPDFGTWTESGDEVLSPEAPDAGAPSPDAEIPSEPDAAPETDAGTPVPDAPPCCAPTNPPIFSIAALPTSALTGGTNVVHRLIVTALNEDVYLKKLTFSVCSTSPSGEINSPALREVGMGSDLSGVADVTLDPAGCGAGNSLYRVRVALDAPYAIAADQSRTLDLRLTVQAFQSGESITTGVRQDFTGPACGTLTGTCAEVGIAGTAQNLIWSHDLATWHNGASIDWDPAGAQTLTRY